MPNKYQDEVKAIQKIRDIHPRRPAATLAREITDSKGLAGDALRLSYDATRGVHRIGGTFRSFFSVYSAIRRYDARKATIDAFTHIAPQPVSPGGTAVA